MARQKRLQFKTAFDTYQVVGQLGAGGAGVVFEVAGSDGQHCALKLLDKSKTTTQKRKRFENEIHFCSRTEHPNIVRVLGSGVADDDSPFYLMPIYPSTLRKAMDSGINHADVLPIFNQLLNGLEAAHLLNVWHRDLKPENVLHDPKGNVFVLADFGIARFREEDLHTAVETSNRERLASFQYAAPEQRARGRQVNQAADIYAAGLVLNEMFTGEVPQGAGYKRIGEVAPDFAFLDDLVEAMIQQAAERRMQSIAIVKEELIGRGQQFVAQQKLDMVKKAVVAETELDDPLVREPITLIGFDYQNDNLELKLSAYPNPVWQRFFQNPHVRGSFSYVGGVVQPQLFGFRGNIATIRIEDERYVQRAIDLFKEYLQGTNLQYSEWAHTQHQQAIMEQRRALQRQVEQAEKRKRVLSAIRI